MNFNHFKQAVALAAQGRLLAEAASIERALLKKESVKCAQALNRFATTSLEAQDRGERPRRRVLPSALLPPVA
jgi:L-asparaginase II